MTYKENSWNLAIICTWNASTFVGRQLHCWLYISTISILRVTSNIQYLCWTRLKVIVGFTAYDVQWIVHAFIMKFSSSLTECIEVSTLFLLVFPSWPGWKSFPSISRTDFPCFVYSAKAVVNLCFYWFSCPIFSWYHRNNCSCIEASVGVCLFEVTTDIHWVGDEGV